MLRYILRRLLLLIPLLLAASAIIFLLLRLGTGDPALDYLRLSNLPPTEEMVASTRELLGLNQPLAMQYLHWLWRALHLDLGLSYATQRPVLDDLLHFLPATLLLTGAALALILVTSLPLGIWAARHRDRLPDYIVRLIAFLGVSMPNFWLAFLLVMLFSVHLQWLPAMGYGDWQHLILPAVSIAFMSLAINARLLRASMLDAASQRHVIWARLRGLSARQWSADISCAMPPCGGDRHGHAHWRADRRHHDYRKYLCLARGRPLRSFRHFQSRLPGDPVLYPDDGDGVRAG
ncbi:nickel transport system permease protein NikB [Klebsiella pneumoniae]|uniref:Nickel transport system permease protein NikB n=1 Tax=Klebsiella pneumoniae TaxID=573 RepID=A0A378FRZ3_KLEPN|nr:nickel transport system permease protein NikB [Klebsiella pneumoniae]